MLPNHPEHAHFVQRLHSLVSPSEPIRSLERLHGRGKQLTMVERALYAPGRHVFIYGDRGVGKSSLAATAANQYQSSSAKYLDVSGSPDATLPSIIASIANQALHASATRTSTRKESRELDLKWLKISKSDDSAMKDLKESIRSVGDAVEVLREIVDMQFEKPIVVIDEFDRIASKEQRGLFADLLKHLGDKEVHIKFIFTGVGRSLDDLLGAHQSAIRQLETIELPKLSWEARWEIVLEALKHFGISIDRNIYLRIAAVSDGYPYYVHLITEKLLWRLYDKPDVVDRVLAADYEAALADAIESVSAELKRPYQDAVMQRAPDYEQILWSTADSEYLYSYLAQMYGSYKNILLQMDAAHDALPYPGFRTRIRNFTKAAYGPVLMADEKRPGLYTYRENMLRGYVRMQAEAHGIRLSGYDSRNEEEQQIHVPARASTGYRGPITPRGIHFGKRR